MLRIEIGKKLSVLPLKTLQPTKIHNKSKISLIDFLEKLRGIKPIFTHFSGHFGLQDGRRGSKNFFFAIFQLSSSRPFIWYQICTENPVIRKKVSKPPYPPLTKTGNSTQANNLASLLLVRIIDWDANHSGITFYKGSA